MAIRVYHCITFSAVSSTRCSIEKVSFKDYAEPGLWLHDRVLVQLTSL